jgi:hypothetical protein
MFTHRDYIIDIDFFRRLEENSYGKKIAILGTGGMAVDLKRKLELLNFHVSFLVGAEENNEKGSICYKKFLELNNPKNFYYIDCFDIDEVSYVEPVFSILFKALRCTAYPYTQSPYVHRFRLVPITLRGVNEERVDVHIQDSFFYNGMPYSVFGDASDKMAYSIHIYGSCLATSITYLDSVAEKLHKLLFDAGYNTVIYAWGQHMQNVAANIVLMLRDGYFHKPNHVILFNILNDLDKTLPHKRNLLQAREYHSALYSSITRVKEAYNNRVSNGIDHKTEYSTIGVIQHKVFMALAKQFGFTFWNIIPPYGNLLPAAQAKELIGLSSRYLSAQRKIKDDLITVLNSPNVKDYTDVFKDAADIFDMFSECSTHFSSEGKDKIAERIMTEMIKEIFKGE